MSEMEDDIVADIKADDARRERVRDLGMEVEQLRADLAAARAEVGRLVECLAFIAGHSDARMDVVAATDFRACARNAIADHEAATKGAEA